jgi:hypothetical protein
MFKNTQPLSYSRKSAGVLLLVGVLAGVTVGGGVGVIAASTSKTVTVCADKKSNILRYAKNGKCSKTETKVVLNQMGNDGAKGATGAKGESGAAGATGATGAKGETGATGAKGETGAAGSGGSGGGASAPVAIGTNCIATKCTYKIGDTGPGGGHIFFVDYNDQYTGLNYLEAAPMGWGNGITVNQGGLTGENTGTATVDPFMKWCSDTSSLLGLDAWANSAVGVGGSNTSTADTTCAGGAIQAVSDYAGGTKTDWFLPSLGEAMLMYTNLRQVGVGGFASGYYWSSSEVDALDAWFQNFDGGNQNNNLKTSAFYVRPVRAF